MNLFNLEQLFANQFGYAPEKIKVPEESVLKKTQPGKYGSYYAQDLNGREVFMPVTLGGLFLPYAWISISSSKMVIETPMTERRGKVHEKVTLDDYKIGLKGFLIGHDGRFPEKDMEDLKTLYERDEAIELKCVLSDIFLLSPENGGQDKVIIKDLNIPENQGKIHVRAFEMSLVSDQIFELEIK